MPAVSRPSRAEILLAISIVLLCAFYARWSYIPSFPERAVTSSEEKYAYEVGDPGPWFSAWALGDGQAYAMIAVDPTGQHLAEQIGEPGYRFARAGYGWLAWAFSLGRADLVPYSMALVGLLSVVGSVVVAFILRPRVGVSAWWLIANPALYIGFAGDTSEPLGILLLTMAIGWGWWAAALALGVTSPTLAVALVGRWKLLAASIAAAVLLAIYGLISFGPEGMVPYGGRFGVPFAAYFEHSSFWGWLLAALATITLAVGVKTRDLAWVVGGLFVLCFGTEVLRFPINAWRVAGFLWVLWAFGPSYAATLHTSGLEPSLATR